MSHLGRFSIAKMLAVGAVLLVARPVGGQEPRQHGARAAKSAPDSAKQQEEPVTRDDWVVKPWRLAAPAFAIAENLYYVGNQRFSSHLVVGEKGMVLIDTPYKEHCYLLTESIRSLGFDPADITMILHTHYHYDHVGCTRRLQELSGASLAMGTKDIRRLKSLSSLRFTLDFWNTELEYFEPFEVDRPLEQGDVIDLGNMAIHCHHTPGHTPGAMTFTLDVRIDGQPHKAVLFGGPGLNFLSVKGMYYDGAKEDFARTLDYLETLDADVWLGAHPFVNRTLEKYQRRQEGETPSPFVDRKGWLQFLKSKRAGFERLVTEKSGQSEATKDAEQ